MRDSSKAALGGIIAALSIVVMLITYVSPLLVYTAPPFAGLLLIVIVLEINGKWAFGTYAAVSLLSVFLIADKEAAVYFVVFFGYYPILREKLFQKLSKRLPRLLIEATLFNAAMAVGMLAAQYFFAVDYSDFTNGGRLFVALYWALMNVVFLVYDYLIEKLILVYKKRFQTRVRNLFRY